MDRSLDLLENLTSKSKKESVAGESLERCANSLINLMNHETIRNLTAVSFVPPTPVEVAPPGLMQASAGTQIAETAPVEEPRTEEKPAIA